MQNFAPYLPYAGSVLGILLLCLTIRALVPLRRLARTIRRRNRERISIDTRNERLEWWEGDISCRLQITRGGAELSALPAGVRLRPMEVHANARPRVESHYFRLGARDFLEKVFQMGNFYSGSMSVRPGRVLIRKSGITTRNEIAQFADLSIKLVDRMRRTRRKPLLRFVDDLQVDDGQCPVCGTTDGRKKVWCRICRVPHHRECWNWVEVCGTYGCGGREAS